MTTPRDRARARTEADILRIGREHLTTQGAAGLSLRAVARDLGVVSSAVYRYVRSRDELLTLLIVDAYDELGDAVDTAIADVPETSPAAQFRAAGRAVRTWALAEPARYGLLFGTPVIGYTAPADRTTAPGTRVVLALAAIWERAHEQGKFTASDPLLLPETLNPTMERVAEAAGVEVPPQLLARGMFAWSALFGAVSWEVFDQYGRGTIDDPGALFEHHLSVLLETLGMSPAADA